MSVRDASSENVRKRVARPMEERDLETSHTVTALLNALAGGDRGAFDRLFPLVYDELRAVAAAQLRMERWEHTLQPTALVHEAYLKLLRQQDGQYKNRGHFFVIAAQAMRRILIDHARRRKTQRREGGQAVELTPGVAAAPEPDDMVLALDEALTRLALRDARQAQVVETRFFAGLNIDETPRRSASPRRP